MNFSNPFISALLAIGFVSLNTVAGYFITKRAMHKDFNSFVGTVFGSMGIRMIFMAASVWFCIENLGVHKLSFALTFVISAFLFMMGEVLHIHLSHERTRKQAGSSVLEIVKKKFNHDPETAFAYAI